MGRPQLKAHADHATMNAPDAMKTIVAEVAVSNAARAGAADVLSFRALARAVSCVARRAPHAADLNASLTRAINLNEALASKVLKAIYSE